jgi:PST family polysaccharide transporter
VGYFAAADKIVQAVKGLYQPVSQSIYPLVGKKMHDDKRDGIKIINKIFLFIVPVMLFISILLFSLADPIVNILLGKQYQRSVLLLQIMSFLPFIISLSNKFGVQTMLNIGLKKAFSNILIIAAILGISLTVVIVPIFKDLGSSIVMLIVEVFVVIVMYVYLKIIKGI